MYLSGTACGRTAWVRILNNLVDTVLLSTAGDPMVVSYPLLEDDGRMVAYLNDGVPAEPAN